MSELPQPLVPIDAGSTAPALVTAAESFLRTHSGETVDGVIARRALGHYWESLRQYLAIRAGEERADRALTALEGGHAVTSLLAPPGPRARLFRAGRVALGELAREEHGLAWWTPADAARADRLARVRASLDPDGRELLELRYTRALSIDEIAFVLDRPSAEVEPALREARGRAEAVLRARGVARRDVDDHLREAFALERARREPPRARLLPAGEVISDRYEIESHIGSGAFADVYRARDREVPDHVVALKIRRQRSDHEASRAAARRELRVIASVFHPSIVQLKDHGWHEGRLWFVMPCYRGETLAERVRRGPLGRHEARTIFEPLANALAAMHRAGVRHQDVKPENVFLARLEPSDGEEAEILPVLLDLGVAVRDAEAVLAGTPGYFAPEVAALFAGIPDPPALSARSDVFSLALALRNALEPETMEDVVGGSVDAFVARRARRVPDPPSSPSLAFLHSSFARWLALSPDDRPSAEELARELRILTRPEERRATAWSILRWVAPLVVVFTTLGGAGFWIASREAKLQRLEAERARQQAQTQREIAQSAQARAANFRNDLSEESRMRRQLEQQVAQLQSEYQSSRMTRQDLVSRLARTEAELGVLEQRHEESVRQSGRDLTALREERDSLRTELDSSQAALAQAQSRLASANEGEQQLRRRVTEAERERDEARGDARSMRLALEFAGVRVPPSPFGDDDEDGGAEPEATPAEE